MKKALTLLVITVFAAGMLMMTSCKTSVFGFVSETDKLMVADAENAEVDASATLSGAVVAEGEQINITSNLDSGKIRIDFFAAPEEESADETPEAEGDPLDSAEVSGTDTYTSTLGEGSYYVMATVVEEATGTVSVEIK